MRKVCEVTALITLALVLLGMNCQTSAQEQSKHGNPPGAAPVVNTAEAPTLGTNQALLRNYLVHGTQGGTFFAA